MLKLLNIANLAVVDQLQLEFRSGLNVLSGETGSGKSIIIDALGLLLGDRASQDLIRTGETKAYVEGIFGIEGNWPLLELLHEAGIELGDEELLIKRELAPNSRSRIFINNQSVTLALLKSIQPHITDIHGQGDQQSLLSADAQLKLLDAYAEAAEVRQRVEKLYAVLLQLAQELHAARHDESERLQLLDIIEYQLKEIERAAVSPNEDAELENERNLLANAEKLALLCSEAYDLLYEEEQSVIAQMGGIQRKINELVAVDSQFTEPSEQLGSIKYALEDLAFWLRNYRENIQVSPERLRAVDDRLIELDKLKRKYGGSLQAMLETFDKLQQRQKELQESEQRGQETEQRLKAVYEEYCEQAEKLSRLRRGQARIFERAVMEEFKEVALEHARFSVNFNEPQVTDKLGQWAPAGRKAALGRTGREVVEFYFSANKGEDLRPLSDVASGGELSRLMLVLKTITAPTQFPRTLIFDEIDAGIGGRVSDAVGQRLKRLAATNQVLCITHQAQIARYADAHFLVTKEIHGERTKTQTAELNQPGRVEELARMIDGSEITATARKHAKEMLRAKG